MSSPRVLLSVVLLLICVAKADEKQSGTAAHKPVPKKGQAIQPGPAKPAPNELAKTFDYAQEPFVFEQYKDAWRFENDGTGRREQSARIRVQSEGGVQTLGQLVFGYNSANERMEIGYVRVRKADGTLVTAAADAAQDLPSAIQREAPVYTDFREKHVMVPGLRPGETLEYDVVTVMHTPLVPGHFWLSHDFEKRAIVLDEQVEVDVPKGRAIKLKTQPGADAKMEERGSRRIYRWKTAHLEREEKADAKGAAKKRPADQGRPPAVQLTTFSSWDELGKWYAGLERDRVAPTPEIRAKAEQITQGKKTELEKIEALYDYVSANFRYVSLSFGVGRLQPHPAAAVLANEYGDCKDKHTLLASLLESAGIKADAVLIHSQRKLDPEVPAPSQFDHMITAVPQGDGYLWLDSTAQVAPFRMLLANLRKKKALVIAADGTTRIVETPPDPPFPSRTEMTVTGKVTDLGKLQATVRQRTRGDQEILLRYLFRNTPQHKWQDLTEQLSAMFGLRGEVTEVKISDVANTREPFELSYQIVQSGYIDWSSRQSQPYVYMPTITIPDVDPDADSAEPIKIGPPSEVETKLTLEMPAAFSVRPPVPFRVKRDYGEYSASYVMDGQTFKAERHIKISERELPASRGRDYANFRQNLRSDEDQKLTIESAVAGTADALKDAKTEEIYDSSITAYRNQKFDLSAQLLQRVVEREPKHKWAWNDLGRAYLAMNRMGDAIQALQKQIEVEPFHIYAYNNLGRAYWREQKYEPAAAAFQKQLEINPLDEFAHGNLGMMYCEWGKYEEAAPELEKAITLTPQDANLYVSLGQAYLNLNQPEKAQQAFAKAVDIAPNPNTWNNVAYQLAEKGVHLDRAQQYAESAVAAVAASLRNVTLDRVRIQEAALVAGLGAYWDTLGWVHFQKGELDKAEKYIKASWQLMQHGEVGDHLGQIYEKRGRKEDARHMYALALAGYRPIPGTRKRLSALLGDEKKVDAEVKKVQPEVDALRSVQVPAPGSGPAQADFLVLLSGSKVEEVKFLRGDDKLQALLEALRAAKYEVSFPDETPTKIVRRGTVSCSSGQTLCTFTMVPPDAVSSVN